MFDNKIMIGFIWTLILLIGRTESNKNPTARCDVGSYYETLPLIGEEAAILKLDQIFRGYNLEYSLEGEEEWKDYIKMGEKIRLQKKEVPDVPMLGLKTHHLHNIGNSWGTSFIVMLWHIVRRWRKGPRKLMCIMECSIPTKLHQ